jgi:hypothetical protein
MRKSSEAAMAAGLASGAEQEQDPPNVRVLKYVVIFLGVLLIGCLLTVFGIVGYRFVNPQARAAAQQNKYSEMELGIGANAQLGQVVLDGDRLALHVRGVANDELLVIDSRHGRLISRIKLSKSLQPGQAKW